MEINKVFVSSLLQTEVEVESENKEEMIRSVLGKDVSILKRKGKTFTLRELREIVDNEPKQLTLFECTDFGGCGCFLDGLGEEKDDTVRKDN